MSIELESGEKVKRRRAALVDNVDKGQLTMRVYVGDKILYFLFSIQWHNRQVDFRLFQNKIGRVF